MKENNYLTLLYANIPLEQLNKNIEMLANNENYDNEMFIQKGEMGSWEGEAKVLATRGYPKVADVLPKMFRWLQDLTWPGAQEIFDFLSTLPNNVLVKQLEQSALIAIKEKDEIWLYFMRELLEKTDLTINDFSNKEIYTILSTIDI